MRNIILKGSAEMKTVLASLTIGACQAIAKEYAGNPGSPTTSNGHASANAVSQYDVACLQVSTHTKQMP